MNFDNVMNTDFVKMMSPEFISSMMVMLFIIIISFVVYFKQKKVSPYEKPKGIVGLMETIVDFGDRQVNDLMGCPAYFSNFAGYIIPLYAYIFLGFFLGMMGLPNLIYLGPSSEGYLLNEGKLFAAIPNPFDNLAFTLSLSFLSVVLIEFTKMRTQKWNYWKQFVFTFPPFLPLLTNFTPMLSMGIRLFGNSFAGVCIMTLCYGGLNQIANGWGLVASPLLMPALHFYFDLFSGFIQALVFVMITMMDIAQEAPEIESQKEIAKAVTLKAEM